VGKRTEDLCTQETVGRSGPRTFATICRGAGGRRRPDDRERLEVGPHLVGLATPPAAAGAATLPARLSPLFSGAFRCPHPGGRRGFLTTDPGPGLLRALLGRAGRAGIGKLPWVLGVAALLYHRRRAPAARPLLGHPERDPELLGTLRHAPLRLQLSHDLLQREPVGRAAQGCGGLASGGPDYVLRGCSGSGLRRLLRSPTTTLPAARAPRTGRGFAEGSAGLCRCCR